jgi:membrane protease YdiL (CAAX protease family)
VPGDDIRDISKRLEREPQPMRRFGLAATLSFAFVALMFGQAVGFDAMSAAVGPDLTPTGWDGAAVAVSLLVGNPIQVITLALAARITEEDLFAYLALDVPRRRDVAIAVAGLALLILAGDGLTLALGRNLASPFELDIHSTALAKGALLPLWIAVLLVAPVGEEILFRGFLFRGFIHEPRDALPGILAISLIWALLHLQYDGFGTALVFVLGVFLGLARLWSGSTTLVILLHMLANLESVVETVAVLGWV